MLPAAEDESVWHRSIIGQSAECTKTFEGAMSGKLVAIIAIIALALIAYGTINLVLMAR